MASRGYRRPGRTGAKMTSPKPMTAKPVGLANAASRGSATGRANKAMATAFTRPVAPKPPSAPAAPVTRMATRPVGVGSATPGRRPPAAAPLGSPAPASRSRRR